MRKEEIWKLFESVNLGNWSMSEEREFMEKLLCQRFNFFLLTFSLILTAAFTTSSGNDRTLILLAGDILAILIGFTILRAHIKHHFIMTGLYSRKEHPAAIVNNAINKMGPDSLFTVSRMIGIWIPSACVLILFLFTVLSCLKIV